MATAKTQHISGPKKGLVFAVMACVLICTCALAAVWGASSVGLADLWGLITGDVSNGARNILMNVRLPRVVAAALAGCALACAGAVIQAVLNNPLASPNVVGINSGAGFFVLLVSALAPGVYSLVPFAAFVGALVSAAFVLVISRRAAGSRLAVVLAGMALTAIFGAGMNAILVIDPDAYVGSSTFLVGGLGGASFSKISWPAACIAVGLVAAMLLTRRLNLLSLGDETAHSLGINVTATRMVALAVAAFLAGAAVSFAGLLGFVGLIVPHMVRFFLGWDNRLVVPASAFVGATLVVLCDLIARVAFAPYEIPVGIIMALCGGPFFLFLILKKGGLRD